MSIPPLQCLLLLEKELVSLGAMCAASMLKENTVLPFAGEKQEYDCVHVSVFVYAVHVGEFDY